MTALIHHAAQHFVSEYMIFVTGCPRM